MVSSLLKSLFDDRSPNVVNLDALGSMFDMKLGKTLCFLHDNRNCSLSNVCASLLAMINE